MSDGNIFSDDIFSDDEVKANSDLDNLVNHHFRTLVLYLERITDINHAVELSINIQARLHVLRSKMIEKDINRRVALELETRKSKKE